MTGSDAPKQPSRRVLLVGSAAAAMAAAAGCSTDSSPSRSAKSSGGLGAPSTVASASPKAGKSSPPAPPDGAARWVSSGPTTTDRVALTFHTNGDVALAHELLDLLDHRSVRVTAFIVGTWLAQHPDWAARLVDSGHELANHTYTHPTFSRLTDAEMTSEITRCRDVLQKTGGSPGTYFRPSGTANGVDRPALRVLQAAQRGGYGTVLGYDTDPRDFQDPGSGVVARRTIAGLHPGSIVSMHFGHRGTIDALPAILDSLDRVGLRPVTADELLT